MSAYRTVGIIAAWLASIAIVGAWQNHAGHISERTEWQSREAQELRAANQQILLLEKQARKTEQDQAKVIAAISTDYQEQIRNANTIHSADIAAVRSGLIRLRDHSASKNTCPDRVPETPSAPRGRDGQEGADLSKPATEFLLGLARDADDIARQLAACQAVIVSDRTIFEYQR